MKEQGQKEAVVRHRILAQGNQLFATTLFRLKRRLRGERKNWGWKVHTKKLNAE